MKTKPTIIRRLFAALPALMLWGCAQEAALSDATDDAPAGEADAVSFSGTVVSSRMATKANTSLRDRTETALQSTASNGGYKVGLFGAYTGSSAWSATATADFFFNQEATIDAGGANLSYSPQRFWPNYGGKLSFWAYYPYNATGDPGEHGVHITTDSETGVAAGTGMGKMQFTMQKDAANQSDFMISALVADKTKSDYPLQSEHGNDPKRVPLTFHHMLAQVRIYTVITGRDRVQYITTGTDGEGNPVYLTATSDDVSAGRQITDEYGVTRTVVLGEKIPDDASWASGYDAGNIKTVRWSRTATADPANPGKYADLSYSVAFNNIHTSALFTPTVTESAGVYTTTFSSEVKGSLGTVTVNSYVPNLATAADNDWFQYNGGKRVMLNTDHLYGDTYYNRGNILLVVPQMLSDDDTPSIAVEVTDKSDASKKAKITVNLQQLDIRWESGFIYCYALLEELMPGDDKVKGPESIIVVFDPDRKTDQW